MELYDWPVERAFLAQQIWSTEAADGLAPDMSPLRMRKWRLFVGEALSPTLLPEAKHKLLALLGSFIHKISPEYRGPAEPTPDSVCWAVWAANRQDCSTSEGSLGSQTRADQGHPNLGS